MIMLTDVAGSRRIVNRDSINRQSSRSEECVAGSGLQAPQTVTELITRVDLRKDGMEISVITEVLLPPDSIIRRAPLLTFSRFVPLQTKRRGFAIRLLIGGGASPRKIDPTLLKAIARGHKWFNELVSCRAVFTRDIGARERVNERFVRRLIPLAFLSPAIVQAIAAGRHPADLTAEALSSGIEISVEWPNRLRRWASIELAP